MRSENMNFWKCLTIWSRSNYSKTYLWSKSRILWKFTRRVWMGFFLALLVRPVWPVRRTGLTGLAWQLSILPSSRVKQWNIFIFTPPPTLPPSPSPCFLFSRAQRAPIGDLEFQPRKKSFLLGIWCTSPTWPLSQGGPSFSSQNFRL